MRPEEIKSEVNKLELSEKLLLVEDIWDSIAADNSEMPMSMWQKQELDRRYKVYEKNKPKLNDWQNFHTDLRNKYK